MEKESYAHWFENNLFLILTIFSGLFFLLNNYVFIHNSTSSTNAGGLICLVIVWLSFLGIIVIHSIKFVKKVIIKKKDKHELSNTWILETFKAILVIVIFLFGIIVIPNYVTGLGYIWKGSLRYWNLFEITEDKNMSKILFTFPLLLTNFLTGWNVLPNILKLFGYNFNLIGVPFNPAIAPVLYGNGKNDGGVEGGFASYFAVLPKWFLNILNFGLVPKYLNPLDWDKVNELEVNNYVGDGSVVWGKGYYPYWVGIFVFLVIFSNLFYGVINPSSVGIFNGSLAVMVFGIIYMVIQMAGKCEVTGAFGFPCSDIFDISMDTIKNNITKYINKKTE